MHDIIAQLKANRDRIDVAINALLDIEPASATKPRRGRPARKPVARATEIHIADVPEIAAAPLNGVAEKVRAATKHAWAVTHEAGFKPKRRPSRAMVARAERIIAKRQRKSA